MKVSVAATPAASLGPSVAPEQAGRDDAFAGLLAQFETAEEGGKGTGAGLGAGSDSAPDLGGAAFGTGGASRAAAASSGSGGLVTLLANGRPLASAGSTYPTVGKIGSGKGPAGATAPPSLEDVASAALLAAGRTSVSTVNAGTVSAAPAGHEPAPAAARSFGSASQTAAAAAGTLAAGLAPASAAPTTQASAWSSLPAASPASAGLVNGPAGWLAPPDPATDARPASKETAAATAGKTTVSPETVAYAKRQPGSDDASPDGTIAPAPATPSADLLALLGATAAGARTGAPPAAPATTDAERSPAAVAAAGIDPSRAGSAAIARSSAAAVSDADDSTPDATTGRATVMLSGLTGQNYLAPVLPAASQSATAGTVGVASRLVGSGSGQEHLAKGEQTGKGAQARDVQASNAQAGDANGAGTADGTQAAGASAATAPAIALPLVRSVANAIVGLAGPALAPRTAPATDAGMSASATVAPARSLTLQLTPADLGDVAVRLHVTGGSLSVELSFSDAKTLGLVSHERDALAGALRDGGYDVQSLVLQGADASATSISGDHGGGNASPGGGAGAGGSGGERAATSGGNGGAYGSPGDGRAASRQRPPMRDDPASAPADGSRGTGLFV